MTKKRKFECPTCKTDLKDADLYQPLNSDAVICPTCSGPDNIHIVTPPGEYLIKNKPGKLSDLEGWDGGGGFIPI